MSTAQPRKTCRPNNVISDLKVPITVWIPNLVLQPLRGLELGSPNFLQIIIAENYYFFLLTKYWWKLPIFLVLTLNTLITRTILYKTLILLTLHPNCVNIILELFVPNDEYWDWISLRLGLYMIVYWFKDTRWVWSTDSTCPGDLSFYIHIIVEFFL